MRYSYPEIERLDVLFASNAARRKNYGYLWQRSVKQVESKQLKLFVGTAPVLSGFSWLCNLYALCGQMPNVIFLYLKAREYFYSCYATV